MPFPPLPSTVQGSCEAHVFNELGGQGFQSLVPTCCFPCFPNHHILGPLEHRVSSTRPAKASAPLGGLFPPPAFLCPGRASRALHAHLDLSAGTFLTLPSFLMALLLRGTCLEPLTVLRLQVTPWTPRLTFSRGAPASTAVTVLKYSQTG